MSDRYYVVGVKMAGAVGSYSVLDRHDCHREVAKFYHAPNKRNLGRKAQAEAARLNALEALDDAS